MLARARPRHSSLSAQLIWSALTSFAFWLNKLNEFNGNFQQAEMVKAFIVSGEYRDRFPR
jgi:hypothetical protein